MALGHSESRIYGTLTRLNDDRYSAFIQGDDGREYFLAKPNMASYGTRVLWRDLRVSMRVSFIPAESDRRRDKPVALECRVTDLEMDDI